jgi:ABC-type phosphate/phosphonate transport system substrate-binding protein
MITIGRKLRIRTCLCLLLLLPPLAAQAEKIRFIVQPILSQQATLEAYAPLVEYLSSTTGLEVELHAELNFLTYWQSIRKGEYELVLDAAHFTSYRIENMDYVPIAKVPGTVSFSLVTDPEILIFEPEELIGKKLATLSPPSMGMVRLQQIFDNPLREPIITETTSSEAAIRMIEEEKADAAFVPTPLLNNFPDLNVVVTTEPSPHVTFSVSPEVSDEARQKLASALLNVANTPGGPEMLQKINFPGFEEPADGIYQGYEELLSNTWGY